ncbi:MAG: flagella basal body P-ring formation protein FlgA [Nitratiruptor sp.]|nr:flagella basal body P-ring formation protein FlgA [Nitratiruptor sp.]NPA84254.1 flagellar basal body P-ring formation protein FlgA [Campylobacterota bacterium]
MRCFVPWPTSSPKWLWFIGLCSLSLQATTQILLQPQGRYEEPLRLGTIAKIEGAPSIAPFLRQLQLPPALLADGLVTAQEVVQLLQANLIDTKQLTIRGKTELWRRASRLDSQELRALISSYIHSRYPQTTIRSISLSSKSIPIAGGSYRVQIKESAHTPSRLYLRLLVQDRRGNRRVVPATVAIVEYLQFPFAKREIPKGAIITQADVEVRQVKRSGSMKAPLPLEEVIGARAKRTIRADRPIRPWMIEPNYPVRKGEEVRVLYQRGAIRIEMVGEALGNGQKGDLVPVRNLSSGKVLQCKVLSSGLVAFVR